MSRASQPQPQPEPHRSRNVTRAALAVPATILMPFFVLFGALHSIWKDQASRSILITAAWLLVAGTIIFMILEGFSPIDSFYYSFITLATIGYGDFLPSTELSKLVTVAYSIVGLGVIAALISSIAMHRGRRSKARSDEADHGHETDAE
jgi:voltage-gated potassium channel Kch